VPRRAAACPPRTGRHGPPPRAGSRRPARASTRPPGRPPPRTRARTPSSSSGARPAGASGVAGRWSPGKLQRSAPRRGGLLCGPVQAAGSGEAGAHFWLLLLTGAVTAARLAQAARPGRAGRRAATGPAGAPGSRVLLGLLFARPVGDGCVWPVLARLGARPGCLFASLSNLRCPPPRRQEACARPAVKACAGTARVLLVFYWAREAVLKTGLLASKTKCMTKLDLRRAGGAGGEGAEARSGKERGQL